MLCLFIFCILLPEVPRGPGAFLLLFIGAAGVPGTVACGRGSKRVVSWTDDALGLEAQQLWERTCTGSQPETAVQEGRAGHLSGDCQSHTARCSPEFKAGGSRVQRQRHRRARVQPPCPDEGGSSSLKTPRRPAQRCSEGTPGRRRVCDGSPLRNERWRAPSFRNSETLLDCSSH